MILNFASCVIRIAINNAAKSQSHITVIQYIDFGQKLLPRSTATEAYVAEPPAPTVPTTPAATGQAQDRNRTAEGQQKDSIRERHEIAVAENKKRELHQRTVAAVEHCRHFRDDRIIKEALLLAKHLSRNRHPMARFQFFPLVKSTPEASEIL
ncbi:MAG: hypothetical protein ABJ157_07915 [Marinobacter sp.]|uniref:hypothetical protein n=1 Tax=Marinobacter sp. TaxID=50741 RepID=UPI003296C8DE